MKPGELTGGGILFLRGSVDRQRTSTGEIQYLFPLMERRGSGVLEVIGIWSGVDAETFVNQMGQSLKAGASLSITVSRFFCHNNKQHVVIYSASLAPGRWEGINARPAPTPTQTPQPETATH